ncbi:5'-deoxynucleotidase [Simiduia agarivorans]|uniref:5'-nucleotidase n=1 Tax=Simiduia agarivorans (strain DSM 21679 / JCM 13881 / BCRC 17597 / SA1) TaxID=1117647 RepID=K4L2X3_SIMAS|nr:5'-deoxynucleotidase [Simiduia agarivorans]AFV00548.1 5'-nucleotidase [Simiduia agarivorans SA1 = DSM 21679]
MISHFFAYISKLRWISRWGLKRNAIAENVMEHSWEVATIAHALGVIRNREYAGQVDVYRLATLALYHDCSEVITGDMPSPIKYHSPAIKDAYKAIEASAERELVALLPVNLQQDFAAVMLHERMSDAEQQLVKAADTLSAYLKCQAEIAAGNREFTGAAEDIARRLKKLALPEVNYFLRVFAPSYQLTLDELLATET